MSAVAAGSEGGSPRWSSARSLKRPGAAKSFRRAGVPLHVAMLAPPWISVPPPGYGGVESVVSVLTEALVRRGNAVTLFCAPGSASSASVVSLLHESHPNEIERSLYEVDHVARAFQEIDLAPGDGRFDVVHDHCGFTALAMADRLDTPLVHTLHGQFTASTAAFYAHHAHKAALVGISQAQFASAPAGIDALMRFPTPSICRTGRCESTRTIPAVDRQDDCREGPHRAIAAARAAGVPLILAGVIQPGQQAFFDREVAPHLDGERVRFVGEVGGSVKRSLFACARALLMPIRWEEPFGMVMIEALACGTPVIAFPEGAARELVLHRQTGFLVADEQAMATAVGELPGIAARDCRAWVAEHCDMDVVAAAYQATYRSMMCEPTGTLALV